MRTVTATALDLSWDGPYRLDEVTKFSAGPDYGVYQIYGTHNVLGPDTLLYIGMAVDASFGQRIPAHREWIDWEPGTTAIYLGRLCGTDPMTEERYDEWCEMIRRAEALLIYYCSPPYNSAGIKTLRNCPETIVLNFKLRHRLPLIVSNIYEAANASNLNAYGS